MGRHSCAIAQTLASRGRHGLVTKAIVRVTFDSQGGAAVAQR